MIVVCTFENGAQLVRRPRKPEPDPERAPLLSEKKWRRIRRDLAEIKKLEGIVERLRNKEEEANHAR